jgi:carboxymethylenebutenolidase
MVEHDVDSAMSVMTDQSYVNHVPTMTGGSGADELRRFYKYHFIDMDPGDMEIIPVSRTIGEEQIVDEMVISFTHSRAMDYFLPGIAPTGRRIEVAVVIVARFEEERLAREQIYWDQASVLVQIGVLDPRGLPVAGVEVARKVLNPDLPANTLMHREWSTSAGKPI